MKIPPVLVSGAPLLDLLAQGFLHFPRLLDGGRLSMSEEGLLFSLKLRFGREEGGEEHGVLVHGDVRGDLICRKEMVEESLELPKLVVDLLPLIIIKVWNLLCKQWCWFSEAHCELEECAAWQVRSRASACQEGRMSISASWILKVVKRMDSRKSLQPVHPGRRCRGRAGRQLNGWLDLGEVEDEEQM